MIGVLQIYSNTLCAPLRLKLPLSASGTPVRMGKGIGSEGLSSLSSAITENCDVVLSLPFYAGVLAKSIVAEGWPTMNKRIKGFDLDRNKSL
jgi:hypothetical protein